MVVSRVSGIQDEFERGKRGLLVDPLGPAALRSRPLGDHNYASRNADGAHERVGSRDLIRTTSLAIQADRGDRLRPAPRDVTPESLLWR
jgi:hypothetical protein